MKKKPCSVCHLLKPLSQFNKNKQLKDGLSNYCRDCSKKKWLEHKKRKLPPGFTQEDTIEVPLSLEEKLIDAYASLDVYVKGVLVMQKGKVLDDKWYQRKLRRLTKRPSSAIISL